MITKIKKKIGFNDGNPNSMRFLSVFVVCHTCSKKNSNLVNFLEVTLFRSFRWSSLFTRSTQFVLFFFCLSVFFLFPKIITLSNSHGHLNLVHEMCSIHDVKCNIFLVYTFLSCRSTVCTQQISVKRMLFFFPTSVSHSRALTLSITLSIRSFAVCS